VVSVFLIVFWWCLYYSSFSGGVCIALLFSGGVCFSHLFSGGVCFPHLFSVGVCFLRVFLIFSGVRVALSLVFCVMVVRLLVGFVWLNL
jgi:hypothetical protein